MKDEAKEDETEDGPKRGFLNKGAEDEMEIFGYADCSLYQSLTWLGLLASLGLLRLLFHWWPQLWLYATHRPAPLRTATKLLVVDTYEKRFKSIFVKEVKKVFPKFDREESKAKINGDIGIKMAEKEKERICINLANGRIKELSEIKAVWVKKLCYIWVEEERAFIKLIGLDHGLTKSQLMQFKGLSESEQKQKRIVYGLNEINIPIQTVPALIGLEILNPFYMFQIFALVVWFCDEYYYYSIAILLMSLFGIGSAVSQTHSNQKRLRETVHSSDIMTVRRADKSYEDVETSQLVPGDVVVIPAGGCLLHCDALLLNGSAIVNESILTGESVPVTKTSLPRNDTPYDGQDDTNHTLFCGTHVIQTRFYGTEKVHALVIRTGFLTAKGSLVRSILYPPPADFKFDQDSYKFIWILASIGSLGFIYTVWSKISRGVQLADVFVKGFDLFTIIIPPALPGAMTVGKIYALQRLKKEKISCINSRVINVSGSLNCVCFDKTGTLTEDGLDLWGVLPVSEETAAGGGGERSFQSVVHEASSLPPASHLLSGMATCHSLTIINEEINGDPLDLKMFESTNWKLGEPTMPDEHKFDLLVPRVVESPKSLNQDVIEIGILHQYHFSSKLQRMSVITRKLGSTELTVYCKGSPEVIISLSKPETVPEGSMKKLKEYTKEGYRVIALAWRTLNVPFHKIDKVVREDIEKDLNLVGFIIMENRLKKATIPTISTLKEAKIKIVMITGDNIQTAMSVAREAGIIGRNDTTIEIHISNENATVPELEYHVIHDREYTTTSKEGHLNGGFEEGEDELSNPKLALTGKTWAVIKERLPELLPRLAVQGVVFARMSSEQKQQLVIELQRIGYYVGMCGDGANDCGALRAAHVGISLSEAEASVASPFTSGRPDISCVPRVVREGRAALVTSFGLFKFMVLYSFTEFFSTIFLYRIDSNITDFQFLFIDVGLIVNFAFFFGQSKAFKGPIVPETPLSSMLSLIPILSLVLQAIVIALIQATSYYIVQSFPWFTPFHFKARKQYNSFENFAIFTVSQFQYITMAVTLSRGPPYREPIYKNTYFFISIILMTIICIYITVWPAEWIAILMQLRCPPNKEFPVIVLTLGLVHFLVCFFVEDFVINYLFFKKFVLRRNNSKETYRRLERDFDYSQWPPPSKRFSFLKKVGSVNFEDTSNIIVAKL